MASHAISKKRKSSDDTVTDDNDENFVCILDARAGQREHVMHMVPFSDLPLSMQMNLREGDKKMYLNCVPAEDFIYEFDQQEIHSEGEEEEQSYKIIYFFTRTLKKYRVLDVEKDLKPFQWFLSFSALDYDDKVKLAGNKVLNYDQEQFVRITVFVQKKEPEVYVVPINELPFNMIEKLKKSDRKYYLNMSMRNCEDLDAREWNDDWDDENCNSDEILKDTFWFLTERLPDEFRVEPLNRPLKHCQWEIMFSENEWQ